MVKGCEPRLFLDTHGQQRSSYYRVDFCKERLQTVVVADA